jgi:hypothetical protein
VLLTPTGLSKARCAGFMQNLQMSNPQALPAARSRDSDGLKPGVSTSAYECRCWPPLAVGRVPVLIPVTLESQDTPAVAGRRP